MSYNTAVEVASTYLVNSTDPTILDLRAEALICLNNLDSAINDCKEAKSFTKFQKWEPYYRLGVAYFRQGNYTEAESEF